MALKASSRRIFSVESADLSAIRNGRKRTGEASFVEKVTRISARNVPSFLFLFGGISYVFRVPLREREREEKKERANGNVTTPNQYLRFIYRRRSMFDRRCDRRGKLELRLNVSDAYVSLLITVRLR